MLKNASDKNSPERQPEPVKGTIEVKSNHVMPSRQGDQPRFVAPSLGGVDILKLLTELEDLVENTPRIMGAMLRFDEDRFHMTVMKIRANLPEEMKRASKLAHDSERIVEETRENAERVVGDARKAALNEVSSAKSEAGRIREEIAAETRRQREELQNQARLQREAAQAEAVQARDAGEREAQQIIADARAAADDILAEAEAQAERTVASDELTQRARELAQDIEFRAREDAMSIRQGADAYANDLLANLETVLNKAVNQVQRGRELLEGR